MTRRNSLIKSGFCVYYSCWLISLTACQSYSLLYRALCFYCFQYNNMSLKLEVIQSLALAAKEALFFEAKQCDGKRTCSHYIFAFRLYFCHNSIVRISLP